MPLHIGFCYPPPPSRPPPAIYKPLMVSHLYLGWCPFNLHPFLSHKCQQAILLPHSPSFPLSPSFCQPITWHLSFDSQVYCEADLEEGNSAGCEKASLCLDRWDTARLFLDAFLTGPESFLCYPSRQYDRGFCLQKETVYSSKLLPWPHIFFVSASKSTQSQILKLVDALRRR